MSYYVKGLVQNEYEKRFAGVTAFMVLQTIGIKGVANNKLRGELKKKDIRMVVVKNSLMRLALKNMGHPNALSLFEGGPCTVVFGGESIVDVAKEVEVWIKKKTIQGVRGAYLEGGALGAEAAGRLSKMPTRRELQGQIVSIVKTPGAKVAGAILAPAAAIAGCLKTLIENKEKEAA